MPAFIMVFVRFARAIWQGLKEPEFRALLTLVGVLILAGTWFYARVEGWTVLDSLYFTVITLTTIGYGDLSPSTPGSKLFTIFFILVGLGVFSAFILVLADRIIKQEGLFRGSEKSKEEKTTSEDRV